jgi:hypothetical protein
MNQHATVREEFTVAIVLGDKHFFTVVRIVGRRMLSNRHNPNDLPWKRFSTETIYVY